MIPLILWIKVLHTKQVFREVYMRKKYVLQVTYYNKNYGSVLQAYALQQFLKKWNIDCILICENYSKIERIVQGVYRRISFTAQALCHKEIIEEKRLQLVANKGAILSLDTVSGNEIEKFIASEIEVINLNYNQMKKKARCEMCLFCVAGSDQIWNGAKVYIDPAYFLTFAPRSKRVAFAPSFGAEELKAYNLRRYGKLIRKFDKISVRESSGSEIVKRVANRTAQVLMDPVFLMPLDFWRQVALRATNITLDGKYIFAFFLNIPNTEACKALQYYYTQGYKVVTVGYGENFKGINVEIIVLHGGPKEFLKLICFAEVICTDSFHATAFSVIFQKTFYSFERNYINAKQSARITEFLDKIGLSNRYNAKLINCEKLLPEDFEKSDSLILKNISDVLKYLYIH